MITAAMNGDLDNADYYNHEVFGVAIPKEVPNVPSDILNPENTWSNKTEYKEKANYLAVKFIENFKKYEDFADENILSGAPKVSLS